MKRLTKKQSEFCIHFARCGNGSEAYRKAYSTDKMKSSTVRYKCRDLLKKAHISATVDQLRSKEHARIEKIYSIEKNRTIREYLRVAFVDIRKLFDENGQLKDVHDFDDDTAAAVASIEVTSSLDGEIPTFTYKIKLLDKRQPLQDLAKMLGLFEKNNDQRSIRQNSLKLQVNFVGTEEKREPSQ